MTPPRRKQGDPNVRFDSKVDFHGPVPVGFATPCWLWTGRVKSNGYAQFSTGGRDAAKYPLVHRWNYERYVGPIPAGWEVDHLCRIRHCVNPDHLEAVPHAVNNGRSTSPSATNARLVMCAKSLHELSGENLHPYYLGRGERVCRACHAEYDRQYRERKRRAT